MNNQSAASASSSSSSSSSAPSAPLLRASTLAQRVNTGSSSPSLARSSCSSTPSSASPSSANAAYPKGTVLVSQVHPAYLSGGDSSVGFQPLQDTPAVVTFPDLALVKEHLAPLLEMDSEITEEHVKPLANLLYPTNQDFFHPRHSRLSLLPDEDYESFPPTPTIGPLATAPTPVPFSAPSSSSSRLVTSAPADEVPTTTVATSTEFAQLTQQLAELAMELRGRRQSPRPHSPAPSVSLPNLPGRPLTVRSTSSNHSRSRSRERSLLRLRCYGELHVPCPFTDNRALIAPSQKAHNSARQRRTTRRLLSDLYTFYPSASLAAHHILSLSRSFTPYISWEETSLTHWAKLLDILLLESNGGSWALWSEPSVDYALRAFLEYAIRANPDGDIPPGLDPTDGAKLKSLKYGRTRDYGPLPQFNNYRQPHRRQPQRLLGPSPRATASSPAASASKPAATR